MKVYGLQLSIVTRYPSRYDAVCMAAQGSFGHPINAPVKQGKSGLFKRKLKNKATFHNIRRVIKKHARQQAKLEVSNEICRI